MEQAAYFLKEFNSYLETNRLPEEPENLYKPISYILGLGGKRLRPVLVLMSCESEGGNFKDALAAALAVEVFHNFSLVHDDIMDEAPLRRGQSTVHNRWDLNTGILSGDAMLIMAYKLLESYKPELFKDLSTIFSATALAVCEGQQWDMDFENRDDVTLAEYMEMIRKKTAVLLGASMQMGAAIAGANTDRQRRYFKIGQDLGMAFQVQDDYLDAFGDPDSFGKQVGGDIIENKKTYLYLKALELADEQTVSRLQAIFGDPYLDPLHKVEQVKEIYREGDIDRETSKAINLYTDSAFKELETLKLEPGKEKVIKSLASSLVERVS